jgi:hypothetical protein
LPGSKPLLHPADMAFLTHLPGTGSLLKPGSVLIHKVLNASPVPPQYTQSPPEIHCGEARVQ